MLIKWSGIAVVDGRGKLGGTVFSRNKAGAISRNWVKPANPKTTYQSSVRAQMASVSVDWRGLSESDRLGWNAAGGSGDWSYLNKMAETKNPSGFQLFMKLNLSLITAGFAGISVAPAKVELTSVVAKESVTSVTGPGDIYDQWDVSWDAATPDIGANERIVVSCSGPVSAGRGSFSNMKKIAVLTPGAGIKAVSFSSEFDDRFGYPSVGQKVFTRIEVLNTLTGQRSNAGTVSSIIGEV